MKTLVSSPTLYIFVTITKHTNHFNPMWRDVSLSAISKRIFVYIFERLKWDHTLCTVYFYFHHEEMESASSSDDLVMVLLNNN